MEVFMIVRKGGTYVAKCDGDCNTEFDTGLESFHQAVNYLSREAGWESYKARGKWWNFCPRCSEIANPELDRVGVAFALKEPDD
jgi:hypothetical protein